MNEIINTIKNFEIYEVVTGLITIAASFFGFYCVVDKWIKRKEHFPRVNFDITVEIIDFCDDKIILNIIASIDNKGYVPLKIKDFKCELLGVMNDSPLELGGQKIRNQLNFPNKIGDGSFIPLNWNYSFVYPCVKTDYLHVTFIPKNTKYLLVKSSFYYLETNESHHAGKVLKIPMDK
ncbi:hypothetical protein AB6D34_11810 [Pectobacterium brasiliense]|uniref:Uncharacterized protein n=1 Tax=Pectobacterium brasiliense TaxID=180957 RepID=A0A433N5B6_9GAMM|nr:MULTISPECIES: hypothetical protein [Pectobacterium]GKW30366.1 hypothetical protein PEC331060_35440 [Pectobacterium carotovorum subsp. carotovorum]MBN3048680.1 hypothetical protein [Pectobacterium brasiliense]MBN3074668.1 hypothetical protein [Pectobacterium brasiliense]MBN3086117.1 hypothetical protein [Pectobacterium brasiliense]MBN3089735.1 hypothetical protein [Pectobacterium brasiliense]